MEMHLVFEKEVFVMNKLKNKLGQRGFTLIEMMIVVAIIGILAAVAVPKFAEMIRKSKEGATKGSLSALRSALTIYNSDNEGLAPMGLTRIGSASLTGAVQQGLALASITDAMIPKYIDQFPTAKLGTYHGDSFLMTVAISTGGGFFERGWDMVGLMGVGTAFLGDIGGWMYTTPVGGSFFVNCQHTDTKNEFVSTW